MTINLKRICQSGIRHFVRLTTMKLPHGSHLTRYYMYERLSSISRILNREGRVLSVSHSRRLCDVISFSACEIVEANYPEHNLLSLDFSSNQFDFVVCDQVLEHVEGDPHQAVDEIYRVLKPNGTAILTSSLLYPIHLDPGDYWRFTPEGLRVLCKRFSDILEIGGWGNPWMWLLIQLGLQFVEVPHCHWHPLYKIAVLNNEKWPMMTWIVATK